MISRPRYLAEIKLVLTHNPVCALLGPRQCGKTTLAHEFIRNRKDVHFFDLETAAGRARLVQPELTLSPLKGLIVIDEIQREPRLYEALRPLVDRKARPARFLILGSASPNLIRGISESLAGRVGFVDIARSLGVNERTVRHYLDVLTGTYLVRQLPPWFENISKRQYKSPKVYVRDSGLLHALLGLGSWDEIGAHPKLGASWEGFALEQMLALAHGADAYFWGTHAGAELDLLLIHRGRRYGIEFKYGDAPIMTKSLHVAFAALKLSRAWIVYPGNKSYAVHEKVEVVPLGEIPDRLVFMGGKGKAAKRPRRGKAGVK
jgi:predicted AAA+ superfamily ATPase